ncbi:MAG: hypothetical protein GC168_05615 [Candidatus Hydrogenedens sp.]|nr:hypothetical protein [Candidatus Hydrogenedens sp.]
MDIVQEAAQQLTNIDIAIVLVYMVGVFVLGSFFGRYVNSAGDFFVAGRALPFWAIGMSVVVSDIGATDFISTAGAGYTYGVAAANFDWMGSMPAMVFAAFIFVPYYWRAGVYTIPEFLGKRYNVAVQLIHATIWGVFLIVMLAVMLWLTALMLNTIVGWEVNTCIWLIVAITGIYTFSGGLSAVVMTDVVQLVVMFVGGFALMLLSVHQAGGWGAMHDKIVQQQPDAVVNIFFETTDEANAFNPDAVFSQAVEKAGLGATEIRMTTDEEGKHRAWIIELTGLLDEDATTDRAGATRRAISEALAGTVPDDAEMEVMVRNYEHHFELLLPHKSSTPYPWTGIVFGLGIVMATGYMAGNQAIVQRTLGARSEWDAKGGMLFAGFLKVFIPIMVIVPGLAAVALLPPMGNGDSAVPRMIREILPPGLRGLMFSALFAALMSSVDSTLNSATTIWTSDIYGRLHHIRTGKNLSDKVQLNMGRILTVVFIVLAGVTAPMFKGESTMYTFIQTALSMFQGPVFAILLLGIMWRKTTQWGALAGLLSGVALTTIMNNTSGVFPSEDPFLFVAWWSFVFSVIVTMAVSLVTPQDPDEKVRGLVFGQVVTDGEVQRVLQARVD